MANIDKNEEMVAEEKAVKKPSSATKKIINKHAPDEMVPCRSVTSGELILIGTKSKLQYIWADYGDVAYVEYADLQSLQSMRSGFLVKPRFIIEDEDIVNEWGDMLKPIYDRINARDIRDLFALGLDRFRVALGKLPEGLVEAVKTAAVAMIQSEELSDIRFIRAIDEILGTELMAMFVK